MNGNEYAKEWSIKSKHQVVYFALFWCCQNHREMNSTVSNFETLKMDRQMKADIALTHQTEISEDRVYCIRTSHVWGFIHFTFDRTGANISFILCIVSGHTVQNCNYANANNLIGLKICWKSLAAHDISHHSTHRPISEIQCEGNRLCAHRVILVQLSSSSLWFINTPLYLCSSCVVLAITLRKLLKPFTLTHMNMV